MAFNRTRMELKRYLTLQCFHLAGPFNRTRMELKQPGVHRIHHHFAPFNRTRMELKLSKSSCDTVIDSLLIVPEWN